jgi:hypothetical protein
MPDPRTAKSRLRGPLVYTAALILAIAAGATAVFLVGSSNRRADRAAILAYERAVLPAIREGGRIVVQEMRPTLGEIADGRITDADLLDRAEAWRRVFERARTDILAATPPKFLTGIEGKWRAAMDAYLETISAFEAIAQTPSGGRDAAVSEAADSGDRADDLFDEAAALIQFHRRRLGLRPTGNLPDPVGTQVP